GRVDVPCRRRSCRTPCERDDESCENGERVALRSRPRHTKDPAASLHCETPFESTARFLISGSDRDVARHEQDTCLQRSRLLELECGCERIGDRDREDSADVATTAAARYTSTRLLERDDVDGRQLGKSCTVLE